MRGQIEFLAAKGNHDGSGMESAIFGYVELRVPKAFVFTAFREARSVKGSTE